jgi:RNA polymerase-binding transcription factor DksA
MEPSQARRHLDHERERVIRWIAELAAEQEQDRSDPGAATEQSTIDQHPADSASDLESQERVVSLRRAAEVALVEIDDALRRLDEGRYGRCASCGVMIPDERLEAVPATRFCREHQGFWEAEPRGLRAPGGPRTGDRYGDLDEMMAALARHHGELDVGDEDLEVSSEEAAVHLEYPPPARNRTRNH